jgi:hypothetical protein
MRKHAGLWTLLAILIPSGTAVAGPIINVVYDPGASFSAADKGVIQSAVDFFASNITSNFTVTIAFGAQAGGGGGSQWFTETSTYNDYYNALVANSSGDATDTSAIASLGGGAHIANPVTGSSELVTTSTLASALGLGSQVSDVFGSCGGLTANACVTLSSAALNSGGSPLAGLFGIVQHEVDEVLGTASNLPNGGGSVPLDPLAADLYRYSAPGVRSFALNTSTSVPCTGSPTAYLSVNGGVTNLNNYNNCNNGGDYGDWIGTDGLQVQGAFGPDTQAAMLNLGSPEVTLLDGVGYNFGVQAVPEPSTLLMAFAGLIAVPLLRRRRS